MSGLEVVVVKVVTSEWFGTLVIAPLVAWIIDRVVRSKREFRVQLTKIMLAVQKKNPDWSGPQKRQAVVDFIQANNKFAANIPDAALHAVIDGVVDEVISLMEETDGTSIQS